MNDLTRKRIWVFDNMRARSHVFFRLFSQHPQLHQIYHPYLPASIGACQYHDKPRHSAARTEELARWREAGIWLRDNYSDCEERLRREIDETEVHGTIVFGNEHLTFCLQHDIMTGLLRREGIDIPKTQPYCPTTSSPASRLSSSSAIQLS